SANNLAALLLALRLGHRDDALALARVLPGAAVAGPRTGALALARVDAETLHVTARLLLGAGLNRSGCQERRGCGRDQDSLAHAIHSCLLCLPTNGEGLWVAGLDARPIRRFSGAPERYTIGRSGGRGGPCAGPPTSAESPPAGWFPGCWAWRSWRRT